MSLRKNDRSNDSFVDEFERLAEKFSAEGGASQKARPVLLSPRSERWKGPSSAVSAIEPASALRETRATEGISSLLFLSSAPER